MSGRKNAENTYNGNYAAGDCGAEPSGAGTCVADAAGLKALLRARVSDEERKALENGGEGLYISKFNREVVLRMLSDDGAGGPAFGQPDKRAARSCDAPSPNDPPAAAALPDSARELEADLSAYLKEYMADHPEGHKWIILACLYLTFAEGLPMHPQAAAQWIEKDGKYYCAHMAEDSITCRYCACRPMHELPASDGGSGE